MGTPEKIEDIKFLPVTKRLAYNANGDVEYVGVAERATSQDATSWKINRYSYDVNNNITLIESAYGDWTSRVSLTYG